MQPTNPKTDLSFQHLEAEMQRIDIMIRREVYRWQLAGQDPSDDFRGLYLNDQQAESLVNRPIGHSWGHTVMLGPEDAQAFSEAQGQAALKSDRISQQARQQSRITRLEHMVRIFELDSFELDAFLLCLAPWLDLRYERLYGYLQDDVTRKHPSINLLLDLLCEPGPERLRYLVHFKDDSPLFRHHLLERVPTSDTEKPPLLAQALYPDPAIATWLLGGYQPPLDIRQHTLLFWPQETEEDLLLAGKTWNSLKPAIASEPIMVFYGANVAMQQATARLIAASLQRPLLQVDLTSLSAAGISPRHGLSLAMRDARLIGAVPYITGWDVCIEERLPRPDALAELCAFPNMAVISGEAPWQAQGVERDRIFMWQEFPLPDYAHRQMLWEHFISSGGNMDVNNISGQFFLSTNQIRDAVASARDIAAQRGTPLTEEDLFKAARSHSNPRLSGLARKIVPRYGWSDIVVPKDQLSILHEIVSTVRGRAKVMEEWGIGRKLAASNGVTILFAGPPGTGKTMGAEVIAGELGLDLYKIDLSTIVSKYIGETEKNLERIFAEAQSSNAILFFDEADAIFGKRSEVKDAHDRYANIETSYLLQRMEAYDGVTILATNLRANLDEAFTRRLQFALDFPFPEAPDRLRIWQTLFPPEVPRMPDLDLSILAQRFKLAGGNIRNIIVNAAFQAAASGTPVTMAHLLHGTRRELQKMGRLVNDNDMLENPLRS